MAILVVAVAIAAIVILTVARPARPTPVTPLPLRPIGQIPLPGDSSRFDYASLDAQRGLLFLAHLGASEVVEVDIHARRVLRTIPGLSQVHGVLVVPQQHRVFATATGDNQMVTLDEDTGAVLARSPTGSYPDGLAYDPRRDTIWTTNESGGSETVIDAANGAVRGTIDLGGEVGNVVYDPDADRMLVAVQGRNDLAVIDPTALTVTRRIPLPGCDHDHGLTLDNAAQLAFTACDGNATLLTVDITDARVTQVQPVGEDPDVLAYDPSAHRLYTACESSIVTITDLHTRQMTLAGSDHLADGAHVVTIDPTTHTSYFPIPADPTGHPVLLTYQPI